MPAPAEESVDHEDVQPAMMQLQADLVESQAESENRLQQINELTASLNTCKNQLKDHQMQQLDVSDEDVQRHPDFINLNMKLQRGMQDLQAARSEIERMTWDKENMEATHTLQVEQAKVHSMEQQHKSDAEFEKLRLQNLELSTQVDKLQKALETKGTAPDLGQQLQEQQTLLETFKVLCRCVCVCDW